MHHIMKEGLLSAWEQSKNIQDIIAGRVQLSPPSKKAAAAIAEGGNTKERFRDNAMLTDVPDKTDSVLEKGRPVQQVMKNGLLIAALGLSKTIQVVVADRVKLPSPPNKAIAALLPVAETNATAAEWDSAEERERRIL